LQLGAAHAPHTPSGNTTGRPTGELLQAAMITWLLFERQRRHRAELESRGRLLEFIHLNRTAAAGVLSASFSHEINQPLGAQRDRPKRTTAPVSNSPRISKAERAANHVFEVEFV
jgi:C4-dicarboxylate-specific signal transduction histidine kinase